MTTDGRQDVEQALQALRDVIGFEGESRSWQLDFTAALDALLAAQSAAHRPQEGDVLGITIPMNAEELDWVEHAACLRDLPVAEYIRRAINLSLRKEGVDAVLLRQSNDE